MKKKIKISNIHKEELKKDEMQFVIGGEVEQCKFVCSCSCHCQSIDNSDSNMNSTKETVRTSGWLKDYLNSMDSSYKWIGSLPC